jgi:glycosyltransferase involved in cell wall biosynthesis
MNEIKPEISVIIPTYNRAACISNTIASVLSQTYKNYEIIVVDDGSADKTRESLEPYMDRIRYIYQDNRGVSAARNAGILAASGNWVAFLDSDDEWLPTKLEKQYQLIKNNPSIIASATNAAIVIPKKSDINVFDIRNVHLKSVGIILDDRPLKLIMNLQPFTSTLMVRRETLMNMDLFDVAMTLYEDHDLMCRVALKGPWAITEEILVRMLRRGDTEVALSMQEETDPRMAVANVAKICEKLLNDELATEEIQLVRKRLSGAYYDEGVYVYRYGNKVEARKLLKKSYKIYPTIKSLVRVSVILFVGLRGRDAVNWYRSHRHKGYRR